jgi:putative hydrolase of the HAD superfamily
MRTRANNSGWTAVVFDVGGVIARQDEAQADRELADCWPGVTARAVADARHAPQLVELWSRHSRGLVAADVYWAAVLEQLSIAATEEAVAQLRGIQRSTLWSLVDDEVLRMACAIRGDRGLRVGVLSNSAVDYEPHIERFSACFHEMRFSHMTGVRKPDPAAYAEVAAALDSELQDIVFIDDKERNTSAAERLGMRAVRFQDAASLASELSILGVMPKP